MEQKSSKKSGVIRIILIAVISLVLGFGVYEWNAKSLTGNVLPMPFGVGVGVVMSGSMEPQLSVGDLIVVKECDSYEQGDYVVFQQNGILIVHEIIRIEGDVIVTRGTANDSEDEPISLKNIKGKVVFDLAGVGTVVTWIKSPVGTILILFLAGYFLVRSYSAENKKTNDNAEKIEEIKKEIERLKQANQSDGNKPE